MSLPPKWTPKPAVEVSEEQSKLAGMKVTIVNHSGMKGSPKTCVSNRLEKSSAGITYRAFAKDGTEVAILMDISTAVRLRDRMAGMLPAEEID